MRYALTDVDLLDLPGRFARQNLESTKISGVEIITRARRRSLARLKATTPEERNMKALVLAIAHDAFDDPNIRIEPLQKSISRDTGRNAAA